MSICLRKLRTTGLVILLGFSLLLSPGCALLLLGAGGAGGYLIRKGEEGDSPKKKQSSGAGERPYADNSEPKVELPA